MAISYRVRYFLDMGDLRARVSAEYFPNLGGKCGAKHSRAMNCLGARIMDYERSNGDIKLHTLCHHETTFVTARRLGLLKELRTKDQVGAASRDIGGDRSELLSGVIATIGDFSIRELAKMRGLLMRSSYLD